jgi:RHS repeat-associated protein
VWLFLTTTCAISQKVSYTVRHHVGRPALRQPLGFGGTGATRYNWDIVNRMLLCANATSGSTYSYRADGQRIEKVDGVTLSWTGNRESGHYDTNYATSRPTYRYFYDGQMGIEDDYNPSGTVTVVNRYALGARGIDRVEKYADSTTTYGYPIYDGHGNMRTTLARSGSSYSTGTFKTYDVWGSVRSGGDSGDPAQKYVANLGHVNDPESGLIYMRARYHEPATGRFISEDPNEAGWNWFIYCGNDPVNFDDSSGLDKDADAMDWRVMEYLILAMEVGIMVAAGRKSVWLRIHALNFLGFMGVWIAGEKMFEAGGAEIRLMMKFILGGVTTLTATYTGGDLASEAFNAVAPTGKLEIIGMYMTFLAMFCTVESILAGVGP